MSSSTMSRKGMPSRLERTLERWPVWGSCALAASVVMSGVALFTLINQPPEPNCSFVLWPIAPASVRLYCAQQLATKPTLENLLEAIALVDALGEDHPLRGAINPKIEAWSKLALDKAEENFNQGELTRAIEFAHKIPSKTAASKLVAERTSRWRRIWAEGEAIDARVAVAFQEEDWRKAFGLMVDFLYVDNRYWSQVQYGKVTEIIIQAQQDEKNVVEAESLFKQGGFDNLDKSVRLIRELPANTIFKLSKKKIFNGVAEKLVKIAEASLEREDLNSAIDALSLIPRESRLWNYSQDLSKIANATSLTWAVNSEGYIRAIEELSDIPKTSKVYSKAQALIQRWKGEVASVKVLEEAEAKSLSGDLQDLREAIAMAQTVSQSSDKWEVARENIRDWQSQIERTEDQPILDRAEELAVPGDESSLRSAIAQAQSIAPGRVLYADAQSRIDYWQSRLADLVAFNNPPPPEPDSFSFNQPQARPWNTAPQPVSPPPAPAPPSEGSEGTTLQQAQKLAAEGTPDNVANAIDLANQVPLESPDRYQAEVSIENWGNQLLNAATEVSQSDPAQAIAIARRIPRYSSAFNPAQQLIRQLQISKPKSSASPAPQKSPLNQP